MDLDKREVLQHIAREEHLWPHRQVMVVIIAQPTTVYEPKNILAINHTSQNIE